MAALPGQRIEVLGLVADEGAPDAVQADLGGGVIKQRVARPGQGKSGGFRTVVLYRTKERAFFVYGFAKSDRDNLSKGEEVQFRMAASHVLGLSGDQLEVLIGQGQFSEVNDHDEEIPE